MSYHSFFSRPLLLKILNKLRAKNTGFKIKVKEYQYRLSKNTVNARQTTWVSNR